MASRHEHRDRLLDAVDAKLRIPGFPNIWWMPIQTRTEMITTGVQSPVGIKVLGPDLKTIEKIGLEIEQVLANVPGTKSAFAERLNEGYYLDLTVNRREAARYGLTVGDVQAVITTAHRRRDRDYHRRGARAVSGQRPLQARTAR